MITYHPDGKVDDLATVPLFADLTREELSRVARVGTEIAVPAGAVLCRQGDFASEFFILLEGAAAADIDGVERETYGAGDFFGEFGLLHGHLRLGTVTTIVPSRVLVLQSAEFRTLVEAEPRVATRLLYHVAERHTRLNELPVAIG